jgi:CheY-like chemotaxis protein
MASILLVDDEESPRATLALLLKQAGHDVEQADGVAAAARALAAGAFDLVITDLRMPAGDGLDVVRLTRKNGRDSDDGHAVGFQGRVSRDKGHGLVPCLGDEQSVEWITMMEWKVLNGRDVRQRDGQEVEAVRLALFDDEALDRRRQLELPQRRLDGHFPDARMA